MKIKENEFEKKFNKKRNFILFFYFSSVTIYYFLGNRKMYNKGG